MWNEDETLARKEQRLQVREVQRSLREKFDFRAGVFEPKTQSVDTWALATQAHVPVDAQVSSHAGCMSLVMPCPCPQLVQRRHGFGQFQRLCPGWSTPRRCKQPPSCPSTPALQRGVSAFCPPSARLAFIGVRFPARRGSLPCISAPRPLSALRQIVSHAHQPRQHPQQPHHHLQQQQQQPQQRQLRPTTTTTTTTPTTTTTAIATTTTTAMPQPQPHLP